MHGRFPHPLWQRTRLLCDPLTLSRAAQGSMVRTRDLLLAVVAGALVHSAGAVLPTSCPAAGATHCAYGLLPTTPPTPFNVSTLIALENLVPGSNFTLGAVGLCTALTFECNVALNLLFLASPQMVRSFASTCLSQNGTFVVSGARYTAYGAFVKADCDALVLGLNLAMLGPLAPSLSAAIPNMVVCGTDLCSTPSGAVRLTAPTRLALLVGTLAALAVLL